MLYRIIYISAARSLMTSDDLAAILAWSRSYNELVNVTGLMLYHDGSIMQVLEGPTDKVQALFESIRKDPRHVRVIKMWSEPVDERAFPDWRMGYARVDDLPAPLREATLSLRHHLQNELETVNDHTIKVLLKRFVAGFVDLPNDRFSSW